MTAATPEVLILLAMYRSDPGFLGAQLDSLVRQQHGGWRLMVSDDGPTPDSARVLDAFARAHPGRLLSRRQGPGQGFAANFLALLADVPEGASRVALCDHDDVWFEDKLGRALAALAACPEDRPALYAAATRIVGRDLQPQGQSQPPGRPPSFANALVQSIGGGNTMMLNRAAIDLARAAAAEAGPLIAHDWWLYQIVTGAGGAVIWDPQPVLAYRQHGGNAIGANVSARARLSRVWGLISGRFRGWIGVSLASLHRSAHRFTPEARGRMAALARARDLPLWQPARRLAALHASGAYRNSRFDNLVLMLACILGRL